MEPVTETPKIQLQGLSNNYVRYNSIPEDVFAGQYMDYLVKVLGTEDFCSVSIPRILIRHLKLQSDLTRPGLYVEFKIRNDRGIMDDTRRTPLSVHRLGGVNLVRGLDDPYFFVARKDLPLLHKTITEAVIVRQEVEPSFDKYFWTPQTRILKEDLVFFRNCYAWFAENDIPYRRSYLLSGPPGNGKTMAIRTVAEYLDTEPESFDFSRDFEGESPDTAFLRWIKGERVLIADEEDHPPVNKPIVRLLILEDLDRHFPLEGQGKTRVTLSAILNGLDGVIEADNVVMFATANDPTKLDKNVLIRPGRFHRRIFFDYPNNEEALEFLKWKFRKTTVNADTLREVAEKTAGHSFAFLADLLPSAAAAAFESRRQTIKDEDLRSAVNQQLDCLVKNEGKYKTGF